MDTIPMQLDQLLTLALGVVFVSQGLKAIAGRIGGSGAVIVSAVVAMALTTLAYGAGWVPVWIPACDPQMPLACAQGWIATAGAATALANWLCAAVYRRVIVAPSP